jgi:N-methylhydantoinase A
LRRAFEAEHEDRYGYSDPEQVLELVTIRVTATTPGVEVALAQPGEAAAVTRGRRRAVLAGEEIELEVLRGTPPAGAEVAGPAIVELPESTLLLPPGWSGQVDRTGTVRLKRTVRQNNTAREESTVQPERAR